MPRAALRFVEDIPTVATKPVYENEPIVGTLVLAAGGAITAGGTSISGAGGITLGAGQGLTLGGNTAVTGGALLSSVQTLAANATGTQTSGTAILPTTTIAGVTSGANGDSATLPVSAPGMDIDVVLESASHTVVVFPNAGGTTTETINALSANAGITMSALTSCTFTCVVAGQWWTNPRVPS